MKFFKMLIVLSIFFGCSSSQIPRTIFWWEQGTYSSFKTVMSEISEEGLDQAVIIVCSESFPSCEALENFWIQKDLLVPFFRINADEVAPDEIQSLILVGISLEIPICLMADGDNQGFIGNGLTECTLALENVIRKSVLK